MRVFIDGWRSSEQVRGNFRIGTDGDICCNRFVPPRPRTNASKPPVPSRTSPLIVRDGAHVGRRSQVAVFVPNPSWRNAAPIIPCPVQFSAHFSRPHRSASVSKTFIGIYRADRAGDFVGKFVGVAPMAFVNEQVTVNVRSQFTRQRQRERDLVPKFSEASTARGFIPSDVDHLHNNVSPRNSSITSHFVDRDWWPNIKNNPRNGRI